MESNNTRIAKNTLFLYFRMLLVMGVSLYTVRIVLKVLGVEDYGIYNVVAGIVAMFAFLSGSMASASQRFFAYDIGKKDDLKLKQTFSMSVTIYGMLAILIFILAETLGVWFLNNKMTIPTVRLYAANWVFHFAVFSFIITILAIPYNAAIIAKEKMKMYAYVSIIEVILKLGIVFLINLFNYDKLIIYAIMMFFSTFIIQIIYVLYCNFSYTEFKYSFYWNKELFKKLIGYSGWNLFGSLTGVLNNQGINILLNLFFNPVINAARGIALQINFAINQIVLSFMQAVNPQITKYYAEDKSDEMHSLIIQSSKFSFFLLSIFIVPIFLETEYILNLWLHNVPDYSVLFTRLFLVVILIDSLSFPLMTAAQATGEIKYYMLIVAGTMLLNLPVSYVLLIFKYPPQSVFYVAISISIICLILRLIMLKFMIKLDIFKFFFHVIFKVFSITIFACLISAIIVLYNDKSFLRLFLVIISNSFILLFLLYHFGLSKIEKSLLQNFIIEKLKLKKH